MSRLKLELKDKVAVLIMDEDDNRLNIEMCRSLLQMMDKIERDTEALTMVVKSSHENIWCYGFDVDWINARSSEGNRKAVTEFLEVDLKLRRRLLSFPLITIAAINGHVFGGGAVLSLCFDFRFMRLDRGFFCIPAIDRGYSLLPGTSALLLHKLPAHVVADAVLTGRRITGTECKGSHIVTDAYSNEELMEKVMAFAGSLNKERRITGEMKRVMNEKILKIMEEDVGYVQGEELRV